MEADASERFAMPRGAVRTALVRLEQEGLMRAHLLNVALALTPRP